MAIKSVEEMVQEFAQNTLSSAPVIILGSGASAAHGVPGMYFLAEHLIGRKTPSEWNENESQEWLSFVSYLQNKHDLEAALQSIRPSDRQTQFIASTTRKLLLPYDLNVMKEILLNRRALPLSRLYRHLFDSTHTTINVVTPNYDRLAEYAADAVDYSVFTGFNYGYLQSRARDPKMRLFANQQPVRTVSIWKVHGSLDWFQDGAGQIIALRSELSDPPGYTPLMITPGIDKYRLTHGEPFRTILSCSDSALEKARAYFCVGYGFNDEHVQTKIIERCDRDSVPIVVITKELTDTTKNFLNSGRCRRYLAIEEGTSGSRIFMSNIKEGVEISKPIWQFGAFLDEMIGV